MTLDRKDATRIAKELIREIASCWKENPNSRCIEENGAYIFTFVLQPNDESGRSMRTRKRSSAVSTIRFNPLIEATGIVLSCDATLDERLVPDGDVRSFSLRESAKRRILQMLKSAPDIFTDAI